MGRLVLLVGLVLMTAAVPSVQAVALVSYCVGDLPCIIDPNCPLIHVYQPPSNPPFVTHEECLPDIPGQGVLSEATNGVFSDGPQERSATNETADEDP